MSIKHVIQIGITAVLLQGPLYGAEETPSIKIDLNKRSKEDVRQGAASANLCWLLSSDLKMPKPISFAQAVEELGCGSLRFPYGHLADNYLWHTAPFADTENGLRPKVAAPSEHPGRWDWAIDEENGFKKAMDFDEYMALCQKLDIKPLVVVNVFSCKYEGGPSYETLKTTAVEWVKYAKRKNYKVAYWQIGNEVDHHPKQLSREEYIKLYIDFVTAMKEADPSIAAGPGVLDKVSYFEKMVEQVPQLVDFVSCHQYMYPYMKKCRTYEGWSQNKETYSPAVDRMQKAVENSAKPNIDILITETGVTPAKEGFGRVNNTYKALWWFEVVMNQIMTPNVSYSYFWGIHSPWSGQDDPEYDVGVLLNIENNERKPTGEIIRIVNAFMLDHLLETTRVSGMVRAYASADESGENINIFLLNKSTEPQTVQVELENDKIARRTFQQMTFKGKSPDDRNPEYLRKKSAKSKNAQLSLRLPPLSLTVLNQAGQ